MMPEKDPYGLLNIRMNPNGTVFRFIDLPVGITNPDPNSGAAAVSKEIPLSEEKNTFIRIYLPSKMIMEDTSKAETTTSMANKKKHLPIVFHFHGCSWVQYRANNAFLHAGRGAFASKTPAIVVLVDLRLAPEARLPAQYEDAIDAILWVQKQALDPEGERWLKDYGNFSRCFLFGSGSGGNIAFNVALRALDMDLSPLKFDGIVLNQPLFGGIERTTSEKKFAADPTIPLPALDLSWELVLPQGSDRDHPYCNPLADGPHKEKLKSLPRCIVFGFGMDPLVDRQQKFVQMLVLHGVTVQACFDDVGFHRVDLIDSKRAAILDDIASDFINSR